MSLPDIDFHRIRPYEGNRNAGFEELGCQLAEIEPRPAGATFHRKGRGGDAGVECFVKRTDGTEVGWQAKYVFTWDASLEGQLDESIETALEKHPHLTEYVVCIPFDLSDKRAGKGRSAAQKWEDWQKKWREKAKSAKRSISFTLWGKSQFATRLARGESYYSGRLLYWFDHEALTQEWLVRQFKRPRADLGTRYTPETNVELPIRRDFMALSRGAELQEQLDRWFLDLGERAKDAVRDLNKVVPEGTTSVHAQRVDETSKILSDFLGSDEIGPDRQFPLEAWRTAAEACAQACGEARQWAFGLEETKPDRYISDPPQRVAAYMVGKLLDVVRDIGEGTQSSFWQMANARAVLLHGPAGIGKSHLLADVVEHLVYQGLPAVMVLGSSLEEGEVWRQILGQLDRPPTEQVNSFLGALDAAAQLTGSRALICIDALNERKGIDIWPARLASFLAEAERFPRVVVVLSCRSTYLDYVVPHGLPPDLLYRLEHLGFREDGGEAAKAYLDKRGIVRPGAPRLAPEIENPLFLKTCCDFLEKQGTCEFPRGLQGITSIYEFYIDAIDKALTSRMKLDRNAEIVGRAIRQFAGLVVKSGTGYVGKRDAMAGFEGILSGQENLDRSLLSHFENEGLLSLEIVQDASGQRSEMVRFTFERIGDFTIASELLTQHLKLNDVVGCFKAAGPLRELVFGKDRRLKAGIIEAMAVLLPEKTGMEILDLDEKMPFEAHIAFKGSLLLRQQSHFTDRTLELAEKFLIDYDVAELFISIATEPDNKFNAAHLHRLLSAQTLPERDADWSTHLMIYGEDGAVETLISWAMRNGLDRIDDDRAHLAGVTLTWFLTTSNRRTRDRATKALACLLARRLRLGARLLRDFVGVNDPYVLERLFAACYGAALQGVVDGLAELAQAVFDLIFSAGSPPIDALLRDHAMGIVAYAQWRGELPKGPDFQRAFPPYSSPWPIESVSDELVKSYVQQHERGVGNDAILSSTVHDGDFARYQIDGKVSDWSPAPIGTWPLPGTRAICLEWLEDFKRWASAEVFAALNAYVDAAKAAKGQGPYAETPENENLAKAEAALRGLITPEQWEDFRVRAKGFFYGSYDHLASFDQEWARRWICKRAHELGWTAELFAATEQSIGYNGRSEHRVERIGKKYQWIALRELMARMADNLAFKDGYYRDPDPQPIYQSAKQIRLRDIDPSLLVEQTHYDGWRQWGRTWWVPFDPKLRPLDLQERLNWLKDDVDIFKGPSLIEVQEPKSDRKWLALSSTGHWNCSGLRDSEKELQRDAWFRLTCVVVRHADKDRLVRSLRGKILTDPDSLPRLELHGEFYLGEYPWHPGLDDIDQWDSSTFRRASKVEMRATAARYTCESGGYDFSITRSVGVEMPAPWMAKAMGLRLLSGKRPVYINSSGLETFIDPSAREPGPPAALVDRDAFLQMLEREGLAAVWVVAGEKRAFAGRGTAFGGGYNYTAVYELKEGKFLERFHFEREEPSPERLREFLGLPRQPDSKPAPPEKNRAQAVPKLMGMKTTKGNYSTGRCLLFFRLFP